MVTYRGGVSTERCWGIHFGGEAAVDTWKTQQVPGTKKRRAEIARRDGGAGNRTLVRIGVRNCVYVRRLEFSPSPRAGNRPTFPRSSSRRSYPARGSVTRGQPGFSIRHRRPRRASDAEGAQSELSSAYAASARSLLAGKSFQAVLPGTWTWARCNSLYQPVEASRPLGCPKTS